MKTMLSNPIVPSCTIWLMLLLYFISNSVTHASLQPCATGCSGHGRCNSDSICECMPGWDVAADCSLRMFHNLNYNLFFLAFWFLIISIVLSFTGSCPSGEAWSSRVDPDDWSRAIMPCSNRGRCDFSTGTCYCFPGASGDACQNCKWILRMHCCISFLISPLLFSLSYMPSQMLWSGSMCVYQYLGFFQRAHSCSSSARACKVWFCFTRGNVWLVRWPYLLELGERPRFRMHVWPWFCWSWLFCENVPSWTGPFAD